MITMTLTQDTIPIAQIIRIKILPRLVIGGLRTTEYNAVIEHVNKRRALEKIILTKDTNLLEMRDLLGSVCKTQLIRCHAITGAMIDGIVVKKTHIRGPIVKIKRRNDCELTIVLGSKLYLRTILDIKILKTPTQVKLNSSTYVFYYITWLCSTLSTPF